MALRTRRWIAVLAMPLLGAPLLWLGASPPKDTALVATVKQDDFRVVVTTAGELRAPRFVEIRSPSFPAEGGESYQTRVSKLVPEGTVVKAGDFVAELDRGAIAPKLQEASTAVEKAEAQLTQVKLDTSLTLATARDQIHDLELALEEKKLAKDQARYEAPSIQRQAQLDLDKAERELTQTKSSYATKERQARARVEEAIAELGRQRAKVAAIQRLMEQFTIVAPSDGMVIYPRQSNGRPRGVGSSVSPWEATVATLPDFRVMESVTYVSEVDIAKLAVGQPVRISLDGDPWKRLAGKVSSVANIGEQRNSDAKVFEVKILIDGSDSTLRPGKTTSNAIETAVIRGALSIPIDAVMNAGDTAYVYLRQGGRVIRQQIEPGIAGENEIVIRRGLAKGDQVLLTEPANGHDLPLRRLR